MASVGKNDSLEGKARLGLPPGCCSSASSAAIGFKLGRTTTYSIKLNLGWVPMMYIIYKCITVPYKCVNNIC